MGFMFCDLHVSLNNPSSGDINSSNLPCFFSKSFFPKNSFRNTITVSNSQDSDQA